MKLSATVTHLPKASFNYTAGVWRFGMKIGVLGLQGAVSEHLSATKRAMDSLGIRGEVRWVSHRDHIDGLDGLILPGGESTTIGRLMATTGLLQEIKDAVEKGLPILGTCAGLILMAKEGDKHVERTKQPLLRVMDIKIIRNAFGRQRESFEVDIPIRGLKGKPFRAVFIRAPAIERLWGGAESLAELEGRTVAAKQGRMLAFCFHPELTEDTRIHEWFLELCKG